MKYQIIGVFLVLSCMKSTICLAQEYVTFIKDCSTLPPRTEPPKHGRDLRVDDIKVVMALGDR
jgi:hypothetical protein